LKRRLPDEQLTRLKIYAEERSYRSRSSAPPDTLSILPVGLRMVRAW